MWTVPYWSYQKIKHEYPKYYSDIMMRVLLGKEDIGIHLKDLPYFPSFVRRGEGVVCGLDFPDFSITAYNLRRYLSISVLIHEY
jgi:hypothetical protein